MTRIVDDLHSKIGSDLYAVFFVDEDEITAEQYYVTDELLELTYEQYQLMIDDRLSTELVNNFVEDIFDDKYQYLIRGFEKKIIIYIYSDQSELLIGIDPKAINHIEWIIETGRHWLEEKTVESETMYCR